MGETYETRGPRCPYCGHLHTDLEPHHYDEDLSDLDCESCDRGFRVHVYMSFSWTCRPHEDTSND